MFVWTLRFVLVLYSVTIKAAPLKQEKEKRSAKNAGH